MSDITVDEFIERYCDFSVYEWQREVIERVLDDRYEIVFAPGRRAGFWSLAKAVAEYRRDEP